MSLSDFFSPLSPDKFAPKHGFLTSQMGLKADFYTNEFPDLEENQYDIAIFGVLDDRAAVNNEGCALGPDYFRAQFYSLNEGAFNSRLIDLGNIKAGASISDTYVAVKMVVSELMKLNILPIIIGGGQDLTYPQYLAYESLEQKVDLVVVDNKFDLDEEDQEGMAAKSDTYLNKILLHQPNYLFNFSNIGYQTYYVNQDSLKVMSKLYFDVHRLGEFTEDISLTEPIIRNANMISFDIGAIRSSDAAANANAGPNGFYGEQACRIARYAGMSDKLTSIGFYEFNPAFDQNGQTAMLLAQMVWYCIDGFYNRKKDFPLTPKSQYLIYRASLNDGSGEMLFVKSKKSDRWWMQVPYPTGISKNERFHLVPCRYDDYTMAVNGEMPDLWWRTYQKLL
ncbi:formiminoglutamase-related protein [Pedobacter sp. BAL39]|uniref:formimidoylglutamase n=1 Tax=Pedobacter sp. BAL39 TaxID=391596 RepID=UPI000155A0DD|nr:formimidoylglutamase [Pedobacter sp. BAL39]EDM37431.1 formiminoglutamase-related protein [Pedobacter sp. BAL39]